jgi:hypothetical protein
MILMLLLKKLVPMILILTGDFKCVLDKEIDRYPSRNDDDTGGKELKTIMTKNNLIDIWPICKHLSKIIRSNCMQIHYPGTRPSSDIANV